MLCGTRTFFDNCFPIAFHSMTFSRRFEIIPLAPIRTIALVSLTAFVTLGYAQETPRYEVISEYVRQLLTMHDVQEAGARELRDANNQNSKMLGSIRTSTRIKLELTRNIYALKAMKFAPPFDSLIPNVIDLYEKKRELHDNLIQIASQFTAGPKPGVDFSFLPRSRELQPG